MTGHIELTDADLRAMIADYFASKAIAVQPNAIAFGTVYKQEWQYGGAYEGETMWAKVKIDTNKKPEPTASDAQRD